MAPFFSIGFKDYPFTFIGNQTSRDQVPNLGILYNKSGSKALRARLWNIRHVSVAFCRAFAFPMMNRDGTIRLCNSAFCDDDS